MMGGSDSGAQKMTGTTIDSPKLDSGEATATAIVYNKIGEVGGKWETAGGGLEKHGS